MGVTVRISDFLTPAQQHEARRIHLQHLSRVQAGTADARDLHHALLARVIQPNLPDIDRKLGQKNDPGYLAYALEYALEYARVDIYQPNPGPSAISPQEPA